MNLECGRMQEKGCYSKYRNVKSSAVQKGRNHIFLIELVPGGKREGVNTAKLAIRSVLDQVFDRTHRFRLRRLSQSTEQSVGFDGKLHYTIGLITVAVTLWRGKTESK